MKDDARSDRVVAVGLVFNVARSHKHCARPGTPRAPLPKSRHPLCKNLTRMKKVDVMLSHCSCFTLKCLYRLAKRILSFCAVSHLHPMSCKPSEAFPLYITTPELLAIRGQSSAASFPTGPVMADPFISPLGFTICKFVSHCAISSSSLHSFGPSVFS